MNLKKQREEEKKLRAAEKESKDRVVALVLNTLKAKYLVDSITCSPDNKVNFTSLRFV
jgi:hypothetical protein